MLSIFQLLDKTFKKPKQITPIIPKGVSAPVHLNLVQLAVAPVQIKAPETKMPETKQLVTLSILRQLFPKTGVTVLDSFVEPINKYCSEYGIDTKLRLAAFLAQVGHESGGLNTLKENLNYSAEALQKTFKKYFPSATLAATYARNPVAIGNRVYANRYGNGNEASGMGFLYRGRGLIQLTFRDNYAKFAFWRKMRIEEVPAYLETVEGAVLGAIWYWTQARNINIIADKGPASFDDVTRAVNGGLNGKPDRDRLYKQALKLLP